MKENIRYKIGEEVISLYTLTGKYQQPIIKGIKYKVSDVIYCAKCGLQSINVCGSHGEIINGLIDCLCGNRQNSNGLWWSASFRFIKASEIESQLEEALVEEDYDTAIILRDIFLSR